MKTVNEVSKLTGVSIRTLHYYDTIGLLHPTMVTDAGYRLYDDTALKKLQNILFYRELEFSLKEIKAITDNPDYDTDKALEQQITLLAMKKEHLEKLISFAGKLRRKGENNMDFSAFDTQKMDEYAKKAKETWSKTPEYKEFESRHKDKTVEDDKAMTQDFMALFTEFGEMKTKDPGDSDVQTMVAKLQAFITEHFYTCSDTILGELGKMYAADGEMRDNIDKAGGPGTGEFAGKAIAVYCGR